MHAVCQQVHRLGCFSAICDRIAFHVQYRLLLHSPAWGTQGRVVWKAVGSVSEVVKLWVIKREAYGDCLWLLYIMDG